MIPEEIQAVYIPKLLPVLIDDSAHDIIMIEDVSG